MLSGIFDKLGFGKREKAFEHLSKQLLEFSAAFSTVTDVTQLVPTTIGKIRDIMGVNEAALFLRDGTGERFDLTYSRNIELNPKLRLRGSYHFLAEDKFVRWLLTNRNAFVMSTMTDVFSYLPEDERDILRFINAEMCLGLEAHNRFIGLISLGRRIDGRDFLETDKQLLTTIAAQAALAIENSRLQMEAIEQVRAKRELEIAGDLQRRLLPSGPLLHYEDVDINGFCIPSTEVGGDYFDFLDLGSRRLGLVIGDVAGHGMSAGLLMGMAKSCVNTAAKIDHSVDRVMKTLNQMICELEEKTAMMTCIYAVMDIDSKSLTFCNAGHIYPHFYRASSDSLETVESISYPLGVRDEFPFPVKTLKMEPGDFLLTCSDGFIEAQNRRGEEFGYERFDETVHSHRDKDARAMIHAIREDFFRFLSGHQHYDDLTLIVMRMRDRRP